MLAREAEHRTKNILATVQATVNLSHSDTADGLKHAIQGRIQALAKVHDLFVKSRWTGADLASIVAQEVAPYCAEDEARVRMDGPDVFLAPNTAQAIAVTLHELATNAVKYGPLSVAKGQLEVTWSRAPDGRLILLRKFRHPVGRDQGFARNSPSSQLVKQDVKLDYVITTGSRNDQCGASLECDGEKGPSV
jgi:two-component sensor histidine kinase